MSTDPILSKLELRAVTRKRHRDSQQRRLRAMGIHFKVVDGDIIVGRAHFEAVMAGRPTEIEPANDSGDEECDAAVDATAMRRIADAKRRAHTTPEGAVPAPRPISHA
jgi:hypothetical protein